MSETFDTNTHFLHDINIMRTVLLHLSKDGITVKMFRSHGGNPIIEVYPHENLMAVVTDKGWASYSDQGIRVCWRVAQPLEVG